MREFASFEVRGGGGGGGGGGRERGFLEGSERWTALANTGFRVVALVVRF